MDLHIILRRMGLTILLFFMQACAPPSFKSQQSLSSQTEGVDAAVPQPSTLDGVDRLPDDPVNEASAARTEASAPLTPLPLPVVFADPTDLSEAQKFEIYKRYHHLDREKRISDRLLKRAVLFYDRNLSLIPNKLYMSIVDYSLSSKFPRLFVVNMMTGDVQSLHVAHGKGSDPNADGRLDQFSNVEGSNASSRGFYLTNETYAGLHGLSLKLDGLSSTNSLARRRYLVLHSADYVVEAPVVQGRSWGCLAVAVEMGPKLIEWIKNGSLIYVDS